MCDGKKGEQSFQLRMTWHVLKLAKHVQSYLPACVCEHAYVQRKFNLLRWLDSKDRKTPLQPRVNDVTSTSAAWYTRMHTSLSLFLSVINVTHWLAHCSKYRSQPFSLGTTSAAATQCAVVSALQSLSVLSTFPIASSPTFTRRTEQDLSIGSAAEKHLLLAVNKDTLQT